MTLRTIEDNHRYLVFTFFIIFLLVGLIIFDDYGISWDEPNQRQHAIESYNYVFYGSKEFLAYRHRYYGVVFQLPLILLEQVLGLEDSRDVYLLRHLATFLLFYVSVIFFYILCKNMFNSWKIGLLGCLFLTLSPRIFAHSFYNPKDIPLMSIFIIAIYTLTRYLNNKSFTWSLVHAITCAILINIRIVGIVVPAITFLFFLMDVALEHNSRRVKDVLNLLSYAVLLTCFTILLWPTLWENPIRNFINAFFMVSRYPHRLGQLYLGGYVKAMDLPWHYIPVWISVTSPPIYSLTFLVGLVSSIKTLYSTRDYAQNKNNLISLSLFFIPLLAVIALHSTLYGGWRHMFFIYPAFLLLSLRGVVSVSQFIKSSLDGRIRRAVCYSLILILSYSLVSTAYFMVDHHPHQYVYFNGLGGIEFRNKFQLVYWNLAYRDALEYLLENDDGGVIKINVDTPIGRYNALILKPEDRARIEFVSIGEADYYLVGSMEEYFYEEEAYPQKIYRGGNTTVYESNLVGGREEYPYGREVYSKEVYGRKIMTIYESKNRVRR